MGPTLFLLYVNDIPDIICNITSEVKLFADDTKIFSPIRSPMDGKNLQADLTRLLKWSQRWQLPFNQEKCKVVHYGRSNPRYNYYMSDENTPIPAVEVETDLGVIFDEQLKFSHHVDSVCAAANRKLGIINRTFSNLDRTGFMHLYKAIVRPRLEYCSTVWHPVLKKDITKIGKVQCRATRQVQMLRHLSYEKRLQHLKLPSLAYRRHRADMIQMYKIMRGLDDLDPAHFFDHPTDSRTCGHRYRIAKKRVYSKLRHGSFSQRCINEWNNLSSAVVESTSLNTFKSNLSKFWSLRKDQFDPEESFACPCSLTAVQRH